MHSPIFFVLPNTKEAEQILTNNDDRMSVVNELLTRNDEIFELIDKSDYVSLYETSNKNSWSLDVCQTPHMTIQKNKKLNCFELTITTEQILKFQKEFAKRLQKYGELLNFCAAKNEIVMNSPNKKFINQHEKEIGKITDNAFLLYYETKQAFRPYGGMKLLTIDNLDNSCDLELIDQIMVEAASHYNYSKKKDQIYKLYILPEIQGDYHY